MNSALVASPASGSVCAGSATRRRPCAQPASASASARPASLLTPCAPPRGAAAFGGRVSLARDITREVVVCQVMAGGAFGAEESELPGEEQRQLDILSATTRRIKELGAKGRTKDAIQALADLSKQGVEPDTVAATTLVRACTRDMALAKSVFDELFVDFLQPDEVTFAVLLRGYGTSDPPAWTNIDATLTSMSKTYNIEPTSTCYNVLLEVCARTNDLDRGQDVIDRMVADEVLPDEFSLEAVAKRRVLRSYLKKNFDRGPRAFNRNGGGMMISAPQLTFRIKGCTNADVLAALVEEHRNRLDHIHAATALHHAARLSARSSVQLRVISQLVQVARQHLQQMRPQQLSNTAWALAKLGHVDAVFMAALVQAASSQLRNFNPQNLANTAWALATLGHADAVFIAALVQAASSQLHNFEPQNLANTAWALATIGHVDAVFMGALLQAASSQLRSFNPQNLANTVWALAAMGHADAVFIGALVQAASSQLRSFNSQELANTAWALATMGHVDVVFIDALLQAASSQLRSFNSQDLANTAWALATMGHADAVFIGALVQAASSQLRRFMPQNLANTAWALATMGHADAVFIGALVQAASSQLRRFMPQNLANTAWALATMGHADAVFIGALVQAASSQLHSFTPQNLANTAWALATIGHADAAFMGALVQAASSQLCSFTPQELANMAWALAALDEKNAAFLGALLEQAGTCAMDFSASQLRQLFQNMLWLDAWQQVAPAVPPHLFAACKKAWLEEVSNTTVSRTQLQVLGAIPQLPDCSDASSEHQTDDGLFSIDIALQLPGSDQKLAVEADGPTHFLSNTPTGPTGATRLRNRLLEARGWRVVSVPVTEWDRHVPKGAQAARDYLTSLGVRG
ncbi:hypothetical protein FOA52_004307 [Chlamydomonas sp. UWO 241]|nr:hypothetical protein FOA52_004307 [Chlamydomonas sp. UWO 241]